METDEKKIIRPIRTGLIPKIGAWVPAREDVIVTTTKNFIIMPVDQCLNVKSDYLDYFLVRSKKCYNSEVIREHICHVINYFEKFFDPDKELLVYLAQIKWKIDNVPNYDQSCLENDIRQYIVSDSIRYKVSALSNYNYQLDLSYNTNNASLQYTNEHAKIMLEMCIFSNFIIPIGCHFAKKKVVSDIDDFLLDLYDIFLNMYDGVNMFEKFFNTSYTNVERSERNNPMLWNKQGIRGKDVVIHSDDSTHNIILNIMPKYTFDRNIVSFNFTSINTNTKCQVTDIGFEYEFIPLSSSKRDNNEDGAASEYDKYEASILKGSEAIAIHNQVNCEETMKMIVAEYGPFNPSEVIFFREHLKNSEGVFINKFQQQLVFDMFYGQFGDTEAIKSITPAYDYIEMILAAKKRLLDHNMIIMPYVISGKLEKYVSRKSINKKEEKEVVHSPYYQMILDKYRNPDIINNILNIYATIISSTFRIIDYEDPKKHGKIINTIPAIVLEELQRMTLLF